MMQNGRSALDQKKLSPITLAPNITPRQVFSFIMLALTMASLGGFVQLMMPYVSPTSWDCRATCMAG